MQEDSCFAGGGSQYSGSIGESTCKLHPPMAGGDSGLDCLTHLPHQPIPGRLSSSLVTLPPHCPFCLSTHQAHSSLGVLCHLFPLHRTLLPWMITGVGVASFCDLGLISNVTSSKRPFQTTILKVASLSSQFALHIYDTYRYLT